MSTATFLQGFNHDPAVIATSGSFFRDDGLKMYLTDVVADDVNEYDLSPAWDVTTATLLQTFSIAPEVATPHGLFFRDNGLRMYVVSVNPSAVSDTIIEYGLTTAWDITTSGNPKTTELGLPLAMQPNDLYIKEGGDRLYILQRVSAVRAVKEYKLGF